MSLVLRAAVIACALYAVPAKAAILVTVDKSTQQMTVALDGRPLYQWPVSTGRAGYDTPSGKFKAFRMERDHFSKEFDDAPMPFSVFFTEKGHAIHGSYDRRIGQPASHGCVRLSPANAETLYKLVEQEGVTNTTVVLTGTIPSKAPAVARRTLPRPQYEPQPQYGEPQYALPREPQYAPQYQEPQYAPQYREPQYAQQPREPQYDYQASPPGYVYAEPYGGYQAQPRYVQPSPYYETPRGTLYQDPYTGQVYRSRGSLYD